MSTRVLLAEDEPRVRDFIKKGLSERGMQVETVDDLDPVDSMLVTQKYDLLILDRLLKGKDSLFFVPVLKKRSPRQKILILSALSEVSQKIQGLDYGADDYLGKPFHLDELVARIRNLVRRDQVSEDPETHRLKISDLTIDLDAQKAFRGESHIDLTLKEFRLLIILAGHPHKLFSRSELLERAWDLQFDPGSNVVDVTMGRLKRKLNLPGFQPLIHPRRGVGYSLCDD